MPVDDLQGKGLEFSKCSWPCSGGKIKVFSFPKLFSWDVSWQQTSRKKRRKEKKQDCQSQGSTGEAKCISWNSRKMICSSSCVVHNRKSWHDYRLQDLSTTYRDLLMEKEHLWMLLMPEIKTKSELLPLVNTIPMWEMQFYPFAWLNGLIKAIQHWWSVPGQCRTSVGLVPSLPVGHLTES